MEIPSQGEVVSEAAEHKGISLIDGRKMARWQRDDGEMMARSNNNHAVAGEIYFIFKFISHLEFNLGCAVEITAASTYVVERAQIRCLYDYLLITTARISCNFLQFQYIYWTLCVNGLSGEEVWWRSLKIEYVCIASRMRLILERPPGVYAACMLRICCVYAACMLRVCCVYAAYMLRVCYYCELPINHYFSFTNSVLGILKCEFGRELSNSELFRLQKLTIGSTTQ